MIRISLLQKATTNNYELGGGTGARVHYHFKATKNLEQILNLLAPELFFLNFSTPCIQNVNKTGTKYVRIMKQTAF